MRASLAAAAFSAAAAAFSAAANLAHLTSLDLFWGDSDALDEEFAPGSFVLSAARKQQQDDLGTALRSLAQLPTLRRLDLGGCLVLGPEFFEADASDTSIWPALTSLSVVMSATTPDGRWYFTGDPANAGETGSDHAESPAAFDSADPDASDYAPEFAWDRAVGRGAGLARRSTRPWPRSSSRAERGVSVFRAGAAAAAGRFEGLELDCDGL
ncbi:hypothetical protein B0T26DRAFT_745098 [Lasiosphaeria miniovina]|uniref:Uncharacterized protein n=1 Tax=Lasiosphaeria miniovina TaxID=1954250 RepID=A0AA40BEX9_9PEZI|nr:uncharacterized protein B0T26DRAFT_745098 [Lasiosphaeria miniovina]KAK0733005.1 hypothetical protein B0T26DRAFT_745098 [Lasiosphaeria miniovina]